jgi:hypothetical protein
MDKGFDLIEVPCARCEPWIPVEVDFPQVLLETETMTDVHCPYCARYDPGHSQYRSAASQELTCPTR